MRPARSQDTARVGEWQAWGQDRLAELYGLNQKSNLFEMMLE